MMKPKSTDMSGDVIRYTWGGKENKKAMPKHVKLFVASFKILNANRK